MPSDAIPLLTSQWQNPGDILSLLLLVGGDIVQKAIAQLVGGRVALWPGSRKVGFRVAPVAFSFGWVAYAFTSLMAAFGETRLMPDGPDCPSIVVNCGNAYVRENHSWVLGRILRDHEARHHAPAGGATPEVSMRIELFDALENPNPDIDKKWLFGWLVILAQQLLAVVPWILDGFWPVFLVTSCGTLFALLTTMIPQWSAEKWAGRPIVPGKAKTVCLTRGNGHRYAMVIIANGQGWDLEAMAAGVPQPRQGTRSIILVLAVLWTLLLITVSGLKDHTWYLIGVGGIGMLQNIHSAGSSKSAGAFNVHLKPYEKRPSIIAHRPTRPVIDEPDSDEEIWPGEGEAIEPSGLYTDDGYKEAPLGVAEALMALEHELPKAGAALLPVFFPAGIQYEGKIFKYNKEKKYWKAVYRRIGRPVARSTPAGGGANESKEAGLNGFEEVGANGSRETGANDVNGSKEIGANGSRETGSNDAAKAQ
jgi:hypothetical protein